MSVHTPITGLDLPAIAVAAEQLAARVDARTPTPAVRSALGIDQRVRDLRHIAADAMSAMDGCEASFRSVDEWLEGDDELCRVVERIAPVSL